MLKDNQTLCQFLGIQVGEDSPFVIKHNGKVVYKEYHDGYWQRSEYDSRGNESYYEDSRGYWGEGKYDSNNKLTHCVTSFGRVVDCQPKELTMDDIAEKFDVSVERLKIKK